MKHTIRVQRRAVENLLASVAGGSAVAALVQKSWLAGMVAVLVGIALLITEKVDIQEEENENLG